MLCKTYGGSRVAALDRASRAGVLLADKDGVGGGGRKEGECEGGGNGELGEHFGWLVGFTGDCSVSARAAC